MNGYAHSRNLFSTRIFVGLALALAMLLVAIPATSAWAEEVAYSVEGGDIYFDTDTGEITLCDAYVTSADIPAKIEGVDVIAIGDSAFRDCGSLTSVVIPEGVTSIGEGAFFECESLASVSLPSTLTEIGSNAFRWCRELSSVTIPEGVTNIKYRTFEGCERLTSVSIPSTVTEIGYGAFRDCYGLISITIPGSVDSIGEEAFSECESMTSLTLSDGVASIGDYAFNWCSSLTSVTIPASVASIGIGAFGGCDSLAAIVVDGDNAEYCSINGVLFNKDATELILYPRGKNGAYAIPDGVAVIGEMAFTDCYRLKNVTIPDSVVSIGERAFENTELTSVTIPASVTEIGERAFAYCCRLTEINVDSENTVYSSLNGLLLSKNGDTLVSCPAGMEGEFSIPEGIKTIGASAFSGCYGITSVTIPYGVTGIEICAFWSCDGLTSVTIPGSVNEIGRLAFESCYNLTSVTIQDGVAAIANGAFYDCNNLSSVVIPTTVTRIGYDAFSGCNRLNVYYAGAKDDWDDITMGPDDYDFLSGRLHLNYVENGLTVSVDQSGENWQNGELYVPIGGDAELKVIASATGGDLSYRWVKECEGDSIVEEWMDSTSATLAISNVTEDALYICYVTDMYGTERYAAICVRAGEVFSASAVGDRDIYLAPGGSATLQVSVNAGDLSEIEYAWEYEYFGPDHDCKVLDNENGDSYTVTNADKSAEYLCYVTRRVYDYDNVLSDGFIDDHYETACVKFKVHIDNSFSAWAIGGSTVNVKYNETATLEVRTSATATAGMTYEWTQLVFDTAGDYYDEIPVGGNSATLTTSPVTQYCEYLCNVWDIYGNREWVWFYVSVDNNLSVDIDRTTGGRWDGHSLYVPAGAPAEIRVLAQATDANGLEYQWYQNGILLSNDTSTLPLDAVTYSTEYRCRVIDRYGNYENVWFYVNVDNNLSVTMSSNVGDLDGGRLYVSPGEDVTLTITATADVMDGVIYEWTKYGYNADGKWISETLPAGPGNTLVLGPVNKYSEYSCVVRDQYGNEEYVWCNVSVDNGFSARAKGETTLLVPYNSTPTLELEVSGEDLSVVNYDWYKVDYVWNEYGYWQGGDIVEYEYDSPTIETDPVTTRCIYYCTVRDRFDNTEHIHFEVGVDNDFSATVDGTDKTYIKIEVPAGETASMKVKAEADDSESINYQWYSIIPPTDENGDPIPVATGSDLQLIDSSGVKDTLEVKATKSKMYFSRVIDKFSNMVEVFFHVKIANDLAVTPEEENITVPSGDSTTLTVTPSALDDEGIRYSWQKASYNDQGEFWSWGDGFGSGQSLTLENLTAPVSYRCQVTDKYDNTVFSVFNVSLTYGDEGGVQVGVDPGVVDEEVIFVAELLAEDEMPAAAPADSVVYDLYFENEDEERVQPSGAVTVSIPVPDDMDGSKCKVYYIDEGNNQQLTDMHAAYDADNDVLNFTTDHFSYYAVVEDDTPDVTLKSANLTLGGEIGLNFKLDIPDEVAGAEGAKAVITYKGESAEIPLSSVTPNNQGLYVFTKGVPAKEIANPISIKVVDAKGKAYDLIKSSGAACANNEFSYSVTDYCTAAASVISDAKLKALMQALQNYGHYAHALFGSADAEPALATEVDMSGITADSLSQFAVKQTGSVSGLKLTSMFLTLESETDVNLRFELASGAKIGDYKFTCAGKTLPPVKSGDTYVVKLPNIAAKDLDTVYTVTVKKGSKTLTVKCSALTYSYLVLKGSTDTKLCDAMKALKLYNDAANDYFGK